MFLIPLIYYTSKFIFKLEGNSSIFSFLLKLLFVDNLRLFEKSGSDISVSTFSSGDKLSLRSRDF